MNKIVAIILLSYIAITSLAQTSETRNLSSFSGVKASEGIDVYLKKGDKETARVEVSGGKLTDVLTEVSGSYLKVHMREGNHRNINVKVYVTYVHIDKLSSSSAGSIFGEETIKADDIEISASSAGTIDVTVDGNRVEASASSAADIDLKGRAKTISVDASSAGEIDAYDLVAETVNAEASSGASIKINVTENLNAHASSGGGIRYRGNPDKSVTNSSSGGSVKKVN
ncbi:head GIN domain-containing protein [Chryseosolibacter indicus]|uniref:DUF2807 domain-containing protein n=1 Tax=Chryseosolibacter indicus TaxID=2782351 RepID=A0ABS5VTI5_9BACT|nr:head GIN domain-containing protein [Chryseosolibacter indicus]MBT1704718.1 DUF2807 domain-containing protein [Chryseosolibacter indicus]